MIVCEYGLYFDDVLMDTFILTDTDFEKLLSSVGIFDFNQQNEDIKSDWLSINGGNNPKITIVNLRTLEKLNE